jgi:hypothetical protein
VHIIYLSDHPPVQPTYVPIDWCAAAGFSDAPTQLATSQQAGISFKTKSLYTRTFRKNAEQAVWAILGARKVQVKLSLCLTIIIKHYAMKTYAVSGCIDALIPDSGTSWGCQLHAPAALPPGKEPRYQLNRRLC